MSNYQTITHYNSPNYTPKHLVPNVFGRKRVIKGIVYHWWGDPSAGSTFEGVCNYLCRSNGMSSAHTVGEAGRIAWLVNAEDAAWLAGSPVGNADCIGYECNPRLSDGDYETMGEFHYECEKHYGRTLELHHHYEFMSTSCSPIDLNRIRAIANRHHTNANKPVPIPTPSPAPAPQMPEWIKNGVAHTDKLMVMKAEGTQVINMENGSKIGSIIPRGTYIDIKKKTYALGRFFYISSWASNRGVPYGIPVEDLGIPEIEPKREKPTPEAQPSDGTKEFYTRSNTPVINLATGETIKTLEINTKVVVSGTTLALEDKYAIVSSAGEIACEPNSGILLIYLDDKPIKHPESDVKPIENAPVAPDTSNSHEPKTKIPEKQPHTGGGLFAKIFEILKIIIKILTTKKEK